MSDNTEPTPTPLTEAFILVWSGGYESPQYQVHSTLDDAQEIGRDWQDEATDGDTIDILRLDLTNLGLTRLAVQ